MRALLRIALREARAHKLRSLLVVLLIGGPVAGMVGGLLWWAGETPPAAWVVQREFGGADLRVEAGDPTSGEPRTTASLVAALPTGAVVAEVGSGSLAGDEFCEPGSGRRARWGKCQMYVDVAQLADPLVAPSMPPLIDGRLPERPGEIVAPAHSGDIGRPGTVQWPVGTRLSADDGTTVTVVGTAAATMMGWGRWYALPGTLPAETARWLVSVPGQDSMAIGISLQRNGWTALFRPDPKDVIAHENEARSTYVYLVGTLALFWTGLLAAVALAVGARRRRRELGWLAVNGARPGSLRSVVAMEGFVLGILGCVLTGLPVGIGWWRWLMSTSDYDPAYFGHDEWPVPFVWIAAAAALGVAAAGLAGWVAARPATSGTVLALLHRGEPMVRPVRGRMALGAGSVAVGAAALAVRQRIGVPSSVVVVFAGVLACVGALLTARSMVAYAPRLVGRFGFVANTAARGVQRAGLRSALVVCALLLAIAFAVSISYDNRQKVPGRGLDGVAAFIAPPAATVERLRAVDAEPGVVAAPAKLAAPDAGARLCFGTEAGDCEPVSVAIVDIEVLRLLSPEAADAIMDGLFVASPHLLIDADGNTSVSRLTIGGESVSAARLDPLGSGLMELLGVAAGVMVSEETAQRLGVSGEDMWLVHVDGSVPRDVVESILDLEATARTGDWYRAPTWSLWNSAFLLMICLAVALLITGFVRLDDGRTRAVLSTVGARPARVRVLRAAEPALMTLLAAIPAVAIGVVLILPESRGSSVPFPGIELLGGWVLLPALVGTFSLIGRVQPKRAGVH